MNSLTVEDLKVINIDGKPLEVSALSDNSQKLVDIYNRFRQDEAEAKIELMKVQAAMRDISREIVVGIKTEEEADNAKLAKTEEEAAEVATNDSE